MTSSSILWLAALMALVPGQTFSPPSRLDIFGTYHGEVFHAGVLTPMETCFFLDDQGALTGSFTYRESDGSLQEGTLSGLRWITTSTLTGHWKDSYGTGRMRLRFSHRLQRFRGTWGTDHGELIHTWTGQRVPAR